MDRTHSHALEASAHPPQHLSLRKGFAAIGTYSGGAQWSDWRFSTARWLQQENPQLEALLQEIELLTEEPEEPAPGDPMVIGGAELVGDQQWCCA